MIVFPEHASPETKNIKASKLRQPLWSFEMFQNNHTNFDTSWNNERTKKPIAP